MQIWKCKRTCSIFKISDGHRHLRTVQLYIFFQYWTVVTKKWGHSMWLATSLDALTNLRHFGRIKQYFILKTFIMPLGYASTGIKRWCASHVCLSVASRTSGISRSERPRKSRIGTEVDYVTRNSDTTFNVDKGQGHQAAVLTAVLARHAAAAMGPNVLAVCCYVAVSSAARGASAPTGRRGGVYRGGRQLRKITRFVPY